MDEFKIGYEMAKKSFEQCLKGELPQGGVYHVFCSAVADVIKNQEEITEKRLMALELIRKYGNGDAFYEGVYAFLKERLDEYISSQRRDDSNVNMRSKKEIRKRIEENNSKRRNMNLTRVLSLMYFLIGVAGIVLSLATCYWIAIPFVIASAFFLYSFFYFGKNGGRK